MPDPQPHQYKGILAKILIWGGAIVILVWTTGKSLGWIHSPVWVNMVPYYGAVSGLAGIGVMSGRLLERLDWMRKGMDQNTVKIDSMVSDISSIKAELRAHNVQIEGLERTKVSNLKK